MVKVFTCFLLIQGLDNFLKSNIRYLLQDPFEILPIWELLVRNNLFKDPFKWCIFVSTIFSRLTAESTQANVQFCKASLHGLVTRMMLLSGALVE